jgi:hypothetical protein
MIVIQLSGKAQIHTEHLAKGGARGGKRGGKRGKR